MERAHRRQRSGPRSVSQPPVRISGRPLWPRRSRPWVWTILEFGMRRVDSSRVPLSCRGRSGTRVLSHHAGCLVRIYRTTRSGALAGAFGSQAACWCCSPWLRRWYFSIGSKGPPMGAGRKAKLSPPSHRRSPNRGWRGSPPSRRMQMEAPRPM